VNQISLVWEVRSHASICVSGVSNVYQVHQTSSTESSWELDGTNAPVALPTRTMLTPMLDTDCYGNPKSVTASTSDSFSKTTTNTYDNFESNWIVGKLTTATVVHVTPVAQPGSASQSTTRKSSFTYDSTTGTVLTETVEPDADLATPAKFLWIKTSYTYDTYGNRTGTSSDYYESTGILKTRSSSAIYGGLYQGRFPTSSLNALGHSSTATYDTRFGLVSKAVAPTGHYTLSRYDGFGRKTLESTYSPSVNLVSQTATQQAASDIGGYAYMVKRKSSGGSEVRAYYDRLQRERLTRVKISTSGASTTADSDITTTYDAYGRKSLMTKQYAGNGTSATGAVSITYDALNRPIRESRPDGGYTDTAWSVSGTNLVTTVTAYRSASDAVVAQKFTNSQGWTVSSREAKVASPSQASTDWNTTTFTHDAIGNLVQVSGPTGTRTMSYDKRGRKTQLSDPDTGSYTYAYNGAGEQTQQVESGRSLSTVSTYDVGGRIATRTENGPNGESLVTTWAYDVCAKSEDAGVTVAVLADITKGALCSTTIVRNVGGTAEDKSSVTKTMAYEVRSGRAFRSTTTIGGASTPGRKTYVAHSLADTNGRLLTTAYPDTAGGSMLQLQHTYTTLGQPFAMVDRNNGIVYWRADSRYLDGNIYQSTVGPHTTTKAYDLMARINSVNSAGLHTSSVSFDWAGNVNTRGLIVNNNNSGGGLISSYSESFTYDKLNRLTGVSGGTVATYSYDDAGNLLTRGGNVNIAYAAGTNRPCAWANGAVPTCNYSYDGAGNFIDSPNHEATWNAFGAPHSVRAKSNINGAIANSRQEWRYGPDHQRVLEELYASAVANSTGSGTKTKDTFFVMGGFEEVRDYAGASVSKTTWRHTISSPDGAVAMVMHELTAANATALAAPTIKTRYWHKDHLGSLVAISNEAGLLVQSFRYDPWGTRSQTYIGGTDAQEERGYTGHEMLTEVGLIHMNGRLYDPVIARFLSADPIIQDAYNSQSYNRYAYVLNNPMSYTDPSGFSWWTQWRRTILAVVAAVAMQYYIMPGLLGSTFGVACTANGGVILSSAGNAISAIASGFAAGGIAGGNLQSAVQGALTAAAFFAVGELSGAHNSGGTSSMSSGQRLGQIAGHAAVGCGSAVAAGGSCKAGAVGAAFSSIAGPLLPGGDASDFNAGNFVGRMLVGAIGSKLGGGQYQNGAMTAAFEYLFNFLARARFDRRTGQLTVQDTQLGRNGAIVEGTQATAQFFSGSGAGDEIAPGRYAILQRGDKDGYRLEALDDRIFGNDRNENSGQELLRLHGPGRSFGCITACDASGWAQVKAVIGYTTPTEIEVATYKSVTLPNGTLIIRAQTGTEFVKFYGILIVK
jgi:RHS repeat-associated protein